MRSLRHPICSIPVVEKLERLSSAKLSCHELPRRIFRNTSMTIDPLLIYLFEHYDPSPNSHKGYPLCRAVLAKNYELIGLLLDHGADPGIKSSLPVQVAISLRDLKAVRMLIERENGQDRIIITPLLVECALNKGSKDVVEYFVQVKGKLRLERR